MLPIIEVKNLTKTYKTGSVEFTALKGIDLKIKTGEYIGVMGRSGSGKSTLLYQMSLLDKPTSGEVLFRGSVTNDISEEDCATFRLSNMGYVFQDYALLPELTAIENVILPIIMSGATTDTARKQGAEALGQVDLADKLNNRPSELSGGEKQRVSIARAIANCPEVIFADEPTANLDTVTAKQVMGAFEEIHKLGQTIVMVTHEADFTGIFDRVIELSDGEIV